MSHLETLRTRWRDASLKTSFMIYMLGFLLLALVLSISTAGVFNALQGSARAAAYEVSGLYLYDVDSNALVPARGVDIDEDGSTVFVQTVRGDATTLPLANLSKLAEITDASDYQYAAGFSYLDGSTDGESDTFNTETLNQAEFTAAELPAYDALARERFGLWLTAHPDSPYISFFAGENPGMGSNADDSEVVGLLTSAIGYYLYTPPSEEAKALSTLFGLLAIFMFPLWFGICIFAAARRFFRKRLEPGFKVLDRAAANIAEQNLDFSVSYDRADELGHLATSFEAMRASLAESQRALWRTAEERKRLNAAFAHDLRTPLTILKGKIELLDTHVQSGDIPAERLTASIASLAAQVERLERYVQAMSGLQKLEDRIIMAHATEFDDVADTIEDIGAGLAACADRAFALSISALCDRERPTLYLDHAIVDEVVENLLSNAMRYASSQVCARIDVENGMFVLAVEDDGPGFTPAALEQGCAPFFSEAPSAEHFGLGLNIASLMCEKHGGSLALQNRETGGARAVAQFSLDLCGGVVE